MAKETILAEQARLAAVRGVTLLLNGGVDLLPIVHRAEANNEGWMSPVEAAILSGYVLAQGQLAELLSEQGREDMPAEIQEALLKSILRDVMEEVVMISLDESSD